MKVLRITRHPATDQQKGELLRVFGKDVEIIERDVNIKDTVEVFNLVLAERADVLEAVLPLEKIAEILQAINIVVIRSVMVRNREEVLAGRVATPFFSHYEVFEEVVVKTHRLDGIDRLDLAAKLTATSHY